MAKKYFTRYFIETPNAVGNRKNIETGKILAGNLILVLMK